MSAIKGKPVLARRNRVTLTCVACSQPYEMHAHRAETSKYCSKDCWNTRAHKTCKQCGTMFGTVGHYGGIYCSRECSAKGMVGEASPSWKDGKSLDRNRARQSGALSKWRAAVRERDGHRCTACGASEHLHVHHVQHFAEFPELATDIDNGLTLCEGCHSAVHGRWVGAKSRSPQQATHAATGATFAEVEADSALEIPEDV
jgi:hypothetical protein